MITSSLIAVTIGALLVAEFMPPRAAFACRTIAYMNLVLLLFAAMNVGATP